MIDRYRDAKKGSRCIQNLMGKSFLHVIREPQKSMSCTKIGTAHTLFTVRRFNNWCVSARSRLSGVSRQDIFPAGSILRVCIRNSDIAI